MSIIEYRIGDASAVKGPALIAHVVNNLGLWGSGFVLSIDAQSTYPRQAYRTRCNRSYYRNANASRLLGNVLFCKMHRKGQDNLYIANMFAQNGVRDSINLKPLRYGHLASCLMKVAHRAGKGYGCNRIKPMDVHMPRIGCGLAGGKWEIVEEMIEDIFSSSYYFRMNKQKVYVYDLPKEGI